MKREGAIQSGFEMFEIEEPKKTRETG